MPRIVVPAAAADASEARFRLAADAAGLGVYEVDGRTGAQVWSARLWEIFGLPPAGQGPGEAEILARVHPDDREAFTRSTAALWADRARARFELRTRIVMPDGAIRHIVNWGLFIRDAEGRPVMLYGVVQDTTEAQELRAQAMISATLATLGEMAGGIAHELSQPLQAIATSADVVRAWVDAGCAPDGVAMVSRQLERIAGQAERSGETIRHLLQLSRGGGTVHTCAPAAVVAGALDLVGTLMRGAGVEIAIAVAATLPAVRGDQLDLERVLINLLLNARDATEHSPIRRVTLTARQEAGAVVMDIEDTGTGIPTALLGRVFEPFFTTKEHGKGTGLGLAICRTTLRACGGDIVAANTGSGARFTLSLPLA